jgi:DNA repair and recombination protein RAD52
MTFTDSMKAELGKPLNPKHVKPPAPGKYGEYIEGWRVIDEANRIFGFDGWTRETVEMIELCRDLVELTGKNGPYKQWRVSFMAKVRVAVAGIVREGTGCGSGSGKPEALGDTIESAVKEAETDAMKRALMTFGNPFGLALYDKTKANVGSGEEFVTDAQRDVIQTTASAAGVTLQAICKAYSIDALTSLPADLYDTVMESLRLTIEKKKQPEKVAA